MTMRPITETLRYEDAMRIVMSEARAITNLIGNSVATMVISLSEKDFTEPDFSQ